MKKWSLITILLAFLVAIPYLAFGQEEGYGEEQEWHENCLWECLEKGKGEDECMALCEEIADTGDAGTAE